VPTSTLSRWMARLDYKKGRPGVRRRWEVEDLIFIGGYAQALEWFYSHEEAKTYAASQLEKFRSKNYASV